MDGVVDLGIIGENVLEEELLTAALRVKIRATLPCVDWIWRLPPFAGNAG